MLAEEVKKGLELQWDKLPSATLAIGCGEKLISYD